MPPPGRIPRWEDPHLRLHFHYTSWAVRTRQSEDSTTHTRVDRLNRRMDAYDIDMGFIERDATRTIDHVLALEDDNCRLRRRVDSLEPRSFNGTKGVIGLSRWFEKMESVFEVSKFVEEDKTLTLKGDDIEGYNNPFHELALMCPDLVTSERKKIKGYVRGLPERVKANVISSKLVSLHEAINMAHVLVQQAIQAKATRIGESNKRKWEDHQRNNNNHINNTHHQHQTKRQEAAKAYVAPPAKGKGYAGNLPLCNKCKVGHYKDKCPNRRDQPNEGAHGRAYVMRTEEPQKNLNVVAGTFLLNDHYASILFNLGAEKSFVSITFTPFIDISPTTLDTSYEAELANGKISMVLDSISAHLLFGNQRLEWTATFSISTISGASSVSVGIIPILTLLLFLIIPRTSTLSNRVFLDVQAPEEINCAYQGDEPDS
nr:hypothetical protein [Tanacetum cinerariifolium]